MENDKREDAYSQQDNRANYTPAQERRLRHKRNSPKTHSHADLLVVVDEVTGKARRQPCPRCSPPRRQRQAVGGTR